MGGFFDLFSGMHDDNNSRMKVLSYWIGNKIDKSKGQNEVYDHLGQILGLTIHDKFDVCDTFIKETYWLNFSMDLPDDPRPTYVWCTFLTKNESSNYVGISRTERLI